MDTSTIILIIIDFFFAILSIASYLYHRRTDNGILFMFSQVSIGICAILIILYVAIRFSYLDSKELEEAVDSGYTVYIDGMKVDVENIDLKLYRFSIDEDAKKVFLTSK